MVDGLRVREEGVKRIVDFYSCRTEEEIKTRGEGEGRRGAAAAAGVNVVEGKVTSRGNNNRREKNE